VWHRTPHEKEIYRRIVYLTQASKKMPSWLRHTLWTML
jgi:hypothetical protein